MTQSARFWERIKTALGRGPGAYAFFGLYAALCTWLLFTNPRTSLRTDIVFVLFLLLVFMVYRSATPLWFRGGLPRRCCWW